MPIRILHIIGSLGLGGAQMCVKQLVEHNDNPEIEHYIYPLRSRPVDIPIKGNVIFLNYPHYDPRKFYAIFSLCRQYQINIIHAHLHKPITAALLARCFIKIPVIVHEHGSIAIEGFQYSLYRYLLKILKNKAHLYIAVSNSAAKDLARCLKLPLSSIRTVYNAVDAKRFSPNPEKRKLLRDALGITSRDIVVGYAGRLSYEKGPDILLDALAKLIKINPAFLLVFAGDGNMKKSLHNQAAALGINHRVKFLGFRQDIADLLNIFDIGCIPSRREAFGLAAVEMMSIKIPLVASDAGGLGEFLSHRHNALILKENTPEYICQSILELTSKPVLRQQLIDNAYCSIQQFSIGRLVYQINDIYRKTLEETVEQATSET